MNAPGDPSPFLAPPSAATQPGPLSFGQLLDRVFRLLRANLKSFFGIASPPAAIIVALYLAMIAVMLSIVNPLHPPNPATVLPKMGLFSVVMLIYELILFLTFALYQPAGVYAALQADTGVKVTFRQAYALALRKAGRYIWLSVLCGLIVMGPILLLAAIVGGGVALFLVAGKGHTGSDAEFLLFPLLALLYLVTLAYMVVAMLWVMLACPACVQENLTARAAIGRGFRLSRGGKGRMFLLMLVLYAICYAAVLVLEVVLAIVGSVGLLTGLVLHLAMNPWGYIGIGAAGVCLLAVMFFYMACAWSAFCTAFAVLYRDQRLRREGVATAPANG